MINHLALYVGPVKSFGFVLTVSNLRDRALIAQITIHFYNLDEKNVKRSE